MKRPHDHSQVPVWKAALLLIFKPRAYVRLACRHDRGLTKARRRPQRASAARFVRASLWAGITLVFASAFIAAWFGRVLACNIAVATPTKVAVLQVMSCTVLLAATLGFLVTELQTYDGKTLAERVNSGIFRSGYCIGTALLVLSLVWGLEC